MSTQATLSRSTHSHPFWQRVWTYFLYHGHASMASLGRLARAPFANALTIFVIAIALTLPSCLLILFHNLQTITHSWDGHAKVSLYLHRDADGNKLYPLLKDLRANPLVDRAQYISPDAGLADFKKTAGLGEAISQLPENPLPPVIEIEIRSESLTVPHQLDDFLSMLKKIPIVDNAELDTAWIQRLAAILRLCKTIAWGLGVILGLGITLIIGNTIRLTIQNYHDEIEVIKLVGGTNRFIRLPFLYTGFFYGLLGGLVANACVAISLLALHPAVGHLAKLYGSGFQLDAVHWQQFFSLLAISILLGLGGAWLAVNRQIKITEPL